MKYESLAQMHHRRNEDRAKGLKRGPLHTLQECCEAAGITPSWFGRYAAQHSDAPQPVLQTSQTPWQAKKKHYRKHEFVQWVKQVQQKEKAMPDIKTALQEALAKTATDWAADDEAHSSIEPQQEKAMTETTQTEDKRITNNVSRTTFYYVRDNPGQTSMQVVTALMAAGFKATSLTSLIAQMLRNRMFMESDNGGLTATIKEYVPIQPMRNKKPAKPAKPVQERKRVTLVNTKTGEVFNPQPAVAPLQGVTYTPMPVLMPSPTPAEWAVDSVLDKLSVKQAMAVYAELRKIFGE